MIGGTSVFDRRGFTLIELLIVVVIVGYWQRSRSQSLRLRERRLIWRRSGVISGT